VSTDGASSAGGGGRGNACYETEGPGRKEAVPAHRVTAFALALLIEASSAAGTATGPGVGPPAGTPGGPLDRVYGHQQQLTLTLMIEWGSKSGQKTLAISFGSRPTHPPARAPLLRWYDKWGKRYWQYLLGRAQHTRLHALLCCDGMIATFTYHQCTIANTTHKLHWHACKRGHMHACALAVL